MFNATVFLCISIIFLCISMYFYFISKNNGQISGISTKSSSVSVEAFIGEFQFSLFGYTSAKALVTIEGMGIYDQTYANDKGYFEFHNRFSPLSPREACLTAQDQFGRITSPSCIPPFPTKYDASIGPVILPPTVSLDAQNYYQGDEVKLSGQTIPNSEVSFSVFTNRGKTLNLTRKDAEFLFLRYSALNSALFSVIKPVEAATYNPSTSDGFAFPQLTTKTDAKGNFSLSLPSSRPEFFRLFAQTSYDNSESPESVKLNIQVLPIWMIVLQLFILIFSIIKPRLLEILILVEIAGLMIYFLRRYLHPHVIAGNRSLMLRASYTITRIDTETNTN